MVAQGYKLLQVFNTIMTTFKYRVSYGRVGD